MANLLKIIDNKKTLLTITAITFSICTVAIILIWCFGTVNQNPQQPGKNITKSSNINTADSSIKSPDNRSEDKSMDDIGNDAADDEQTKNVSDSTNKSSNDNSVNKNNISGIPVDFDDSQVKKPIYKGTNTTQVAITFDDGYNKKTVEKVLDILKKKDIKTTFFIIGKVINSYPEVWKRAVNEGHQICNHTNYHEVLTNMPNDRIENEILGWETTVKSALGEDYLNRMKKDFPYLRLPGGGGEKNKRILSIAQKYGYTVVGWNLETFSSIINPLRKTHSVEDISLRIEHHVVKNCSNGSIILLHFNQYDTNYIEQTLDGVINRGFSIRQLNQIIK